MLAVAMQEWRALWRDRGWCALVACAVALATLAVAATAARLQQERREQLLLGTLDSRAVAVLPAAPLAELSIGQGDIQPRHYELSQTGIAPRAAQPLTHPLQLLGGAFDAVFVMLYLQPLLILAACSDLLASDRQSGTLRLLLASGSTSLLRVLAAKGIARLPVILILPLAIVVTSFAISGAARGEPIRLALWSSAGIIYSLFWLAVGIALNVRSRTAAASGVALACAWLVGTLLLPAALNLIARGASPTPSRVALAVNVRAATQEAVVRGSQLLGRFLEDHPATGTGAEGMRQYQQLRETRDRDIAARVKPLVDEFEAALDRQRQFIATWQFISPTVVTQLALTELAGTSGTRHRQIATEAAIVSGQFREEPWQDAWARVRAPLLTLFVVSIGVAALACRLARGLDVCAT